MHGMCMRSLQAGFMEGYRRTGNGEWKGEEQNRLGEVGRADVDGALGRVPVAKLCEDNRGRPSRG
jgi:hypothetical protein